MHSPPGPPSPGTLDPGPLGTRLPPRARAPEADAPRHSPQAAGALPEQSTRSQRQQWPLCASSCPVVGWPDTGLGLFEAE